MIKSSNLLLATLIALLSSCKIYKQDLMFQIDEDATLAMAAAAQVEDNYRLRPNDVLKLDLFTNDGEQLIDPNFESINRQGNAANQFQQNRDRFSYLVMADGVMKLPVIGDVQVGGLTLYEAEAKLEELFDGFYKGSFVKLQFLNKRVVVLGTNSQVIPLENENTSLIEVVALAGGIQFGSKAQNVKLIRGNAQNPEIYVIDLSTVEGMKSSMVDLRPGDIIYIEPWRRPWQQTLGDVSPILGLISSVTTLVFLFSRVL